MVEGLGLQTINIVNRNKKMDFRWDPTTVESLIRSSDDPSIEDFKTNRSCSEKHAV